MSAHETILPGSTIGVLGGGQLGRMLIQAAHRMGYRAHVLSSEPDSPAAQVADRVFVADLADGEAVTGFARSVDVVTFEFENVPTTAVAAAAAHVAVRPGSGVLHVAQNRIREKSTLRRVGLPVTPFEPVRSREELARAWSALGAPAILKTASWGYDGKGQRRLERESDLDSAWEELGGQELILERAIPFVCELSVVAARSVRGEVACFEPVENEHRRHILDLSLCPARVEPRIRAEAMRIARAVVESLDVVGVLTVELFLTANEALLINEIAPRPHNSGHLTIDACDTSQFEQQVRAVCGLPLGSTCLRRPAAMVNLLGDLWSDGPPSWPSALAEEGVRLHLYGKKDARPGRKMGHLTALGDDVEEAARRVRTARHALRAPRSGGAGGGSAVSLLATAIGGTGLR